MQGRVTERPTPMLRENELKSSLLRFERIIVKEGYGERRRNVDFYLLTPLTRYLNAYLATRSELFDDISMREDMDESRLVSIPAKRRDVRSTKPRRIAIPKVPPAVSKGGHSVCRARDKARESTILAEPRAPPNVWHAVARVNKFRRASKIETLPRATLADPRKARFPRLGRTKKSPNLITTTVLRFDTGKLRVTQFAGIWRLQS
ncbi:hypothetical protein KM043_002527 [Ampulex compressa]|nr:hypothetical protein KM043_002527 [Ampulex compressa]